MKRPVTYHITSYEGLKAWREANDLGSTSASRLLRAVVLNERDIYLKYENLCRQCRMHYTKHVGLDLEYLRDSSTMKAITREARRRLDGHTGMDDDRRVRTELAGDILEYCYFKNIELVGLGQAVRTRI